jgi:hypothetical protein
MKTIDRGTKRTTKPDIFISHSSRDKAAALQSAATLSFCAVDVWLDGWELEIGRSLTDGLAEAMAQFRVSRAVTARKPTSVGDVWQRLESIGFEPYRGSGQGRLRRDAEARRNTSETGLRGIQPECPSQEQMVSDHIKNTCS